MPISDNQLLQVDGIAASYGQIHALGPVSLKVKKGEIIGLLGNIGAGKSTLLKCLSGLTRLDGGKVYYQGKDISNLPSHKIALLGIALVPERRRLFNSFTVEENLKIGAYSILRRGKKTEFSSRLENVFDLFPILGKRKRQLACTLSGGEQQMLSIGRAMVSRPDLLLLDEPTLGLAPLVIREIARVLRIINKNGITIVVAEQNASFALSLMNQGYVLEVGNVVLSGTPEQLFGNEQLENAYFGKRRNS